MRFMQQDAKTTCTKIQLFFYSAIFFFSNTLPPPLPDIEGYMHIQKKLSWLLTELFSESHAPKPFYLTNPERVN